MSQFVFLLVLGVNNECAFPRCLQEDFDALDVTVTVSRPRAPRVPANATENSSSPLLPMLKLRRPLQRWQHFPREILAVGIIILTKSRMEGASALIIQPQFTVVAVVMTARVGRNAAASRARARTLSLHRAPFSLRCNSQVGLNCCRRRRRPPGESSGFGPAAAAAAAEAPFKRGGGSSTSHSRGRTADSGGGRARRQRTQQRGETPASAAAVSLTTGSVVS